MKSTLEDEECFEIVKTGRRTGSRKKKKQLFYWRIDKEADLSHFRDESGETYGDRREIVSDESPSWELLISEAILSTDDKKMNLEEISQYIKDNCSYFRKEEFGMVIDLVEVMVHNYCDEEIINSLEYYRLKEKVESGNRVIPSLEEIEVLSAECTSSEEEEEEEDDY